MPDKSINPTHGQETAIKGGNSYGLKYFSDEDIHKRVRELNSKPNNAPASGINSQETLETKGLLNE